ncbi:unnamed protein product [Hermetia illucens]|uniref:Homeobox domain-containing protein n=1 Tax=Hermetia illucens TaxID=343691 RepID=A0A7R8UMZ8_HERIL|nr:unnamed protein product [Hermetia illucens]
MTKPKQTGNPKRVRVKFTEFQLKGLMEFYEQNLKDCSVLTNPDYERMGKALGLEARNVQSYINNRRHQDIVAGKRAPKRLQKERRRADCPVKTKKEIVEEETKVNAEPYEDHISPEPVTPSCSTKPEIVNYIGAGDAERHSAVVYPTMMTDPFQQSPSDWQEPVTASCFPKQEIVHYIGFLDAGSSSTAAYPNMMADPLYERPSVWQDPVTARCFPSQEIADYNGAADSEESAASCSNMVTDQLHQSPGDWFKTPTPIQQADDALEDTQRSSLNMCSYMDLTSKESTRITYRDRGLSEGYYNSGLEQFPGGYCLSSPTASVSYAPGEKAQGVPEYGYNDQMDGYYSNRLQAINGDSVLEDYTVAITLSVENDFKSELSQVVGGCLGYMTERIDGGIGGRVHAFPLSDENGFKSGLSEVVGSCCMDISLKELT